MMMSEAADTKNGVKKTDAELESCESRCGLGKWRPNCLQIFNNPYLFCLILSLYAAVYGYIKNGSHNANTTSYERRFHLTSEEIGWMSGASDIVASILGITLCFYGAKNKIRWVTFGAFTGAFGSLLMGLPHYTTSMYEWGQGHDRLCKQEGASVCDAESELETSSLQLYLWLFMVGYLMIGVSGVTIMTFGMSALDDMFPPQSAPLYAGIVLMTMYVGIGAGYVAGGQSLNLYVDFDKVDRENVISWRVLPRGGGDLNYIAFAKQVSNFLACWLQEVGLLISYCWVLTTDDPRWVGAWWLSFVCAAILFLLFAIFIGLYGKKVPNPSMKRKDSIPNDNDTKRTDEVKQTSDDISRPEQTTKGPGMLRLSEYFAAMKRILSSTVFLCLSLGYTCTFLLLVSHSAFLPKMIQNQFNLSSALASLYAGIVIIPSAGIGQFVGGLLVKRLQLRVRGCLILTIVMEVAFTPLLLAFLLYCQQTNIAGWNHPYLNSSVTAATGGYQFDTMCNNGCNCGLDSYEPVCDQTGLQYFSPCFAGCSSGNIDGGTTFTNCSCAEGHTVTSCEQGCDVYLFLVLAFIAIVVASALFIPVQTAIFRVTGEKDKTLAIGVMWAFARLVGSTPGPIVMGAVIDITCVVWGEKCGEKTSCWIYDNMLLGRNISLMSAAVAGIGAGIYFLGYIFYLRNRDKIQNIEEPEVSNTDAAKEKCNEVPQTQMSLDTIENVTVKSCTLVSDNNGQITHL